MDNELNEEELNQLGASAFGKCFPEESQRAENEMFSNFGMIIPLGCHVELKKKRTSIWDKFLCIVVGHRWGSAGITYAGPGFPRKCKRCSKDKWFMKPTLRMRAAKWIDKTLDKIWKPLCSIKVHRWKSHYGFAQYSFGGDSTPPIEQHIFKCSCCKKIKTVTLK